MDCSACKKYLPDLILGEPPGEEIEDEVRVHLRDCPLCRREEEEFRRAWRSLDQLAPARFPRRISRSVVRELVREKKADTRPRQRWIFTPPLVYLRAGALVLLIIFGAALGVMYLIRDRGEEGGDYDHFGLTIRRDGQRTPDVQVTLDNYLDRTGDVLDRLQRGEYPLWEDLMAEIFRNDIQGRAHFLLENLSADSSARPVVEELRAAFSSLLKTARGREHEIATPPPGLNVPRLLEEIRRCRGRRGSNQ